MLIADRDSTCDLAHAKEACLGADPVSGKYGLHIERERFAGIDCDSIHCDPLCSELLKCELCSQLMLWLDNFENAQDHGPIPLKGISYGLV